MLVTNSDDSPLKTYRIHYRSGALDFVRAESYTYQPQSDEINFFNASKEPVALLPQASGVRSVIDLDYFPEAPALADIQNKIISIEARLAELEKSSG